jgi:glycine dehydrogenase subunit 1
MMNLRNLLKEKIINMSYLVHSDDDRKKMLSEIGVKKSSDLFKSIPENIVNPEMLSREPFSEKKVKEVICEIGRKNRSLDNFSSFLGGGAYNHYIPSVVRSILGISEFYTAYTPYQGEISQGTLQYIFEFQSYICRLTGMDIANASMYDGASSLAEAVLLANRINGKNKVIISETVNPEYRAVCKTYLMGKNILLNELSYDDGKLDLSLLVENLNDETSSVVIQNPNFFGCIESVYEIRKIINKFPDCIFIVAINPISIGILNQPSDYGADIVVGDGQVLGNSLSFGGPYLGFFAAKEKFLRQMPGRIIVKTIDSKGNDAFVMSFQTREQHIRKSKATSNICSNHSLNALAATVYLSILGEGCFRDLANVCIQRAHYFSKEIQANPKFKLKFSSLFFNEFVISSEVEVDLLLERLHEENILGGIKLENHYPELKNCMLISVTEMNSVKEIDRYCRLAGEFL